MGSSLANSSHHLALFYEERPGRSPGDQRVGLKYSTSFVAAMTSFILLLGWRQSLQRSFRVQRMSSLQPALVRQSDLHRCSTTICQCVSQVNRHCKTVAIPTDRSLPLLHTQHKKRCGGAWLPSDAYFCSSSRSWGRKASTLPAYFFDQTSP